MSTTTKSELPIHTPGSRDFYEAMTQFERDILRFKGDPKTIREDRSKVPAGYYYGNGHDNEKFKCYLAGAAYMRALAVQADAEAPATEFAYGMRSRPFGIGAQPKGFVRVDEDDKRARWGVIFYGAPLTADEIYSFELVDLNSTAAE